MRCRKDLFCLKALQGRTAFGQTPPAKPLQGRQHGRKSAAATGSAGHREIARGVAPGVEGSGGLSYHTSRSKDRSLRQLLQKIAFPCRSCRRLRSFDSGFRSCGDPINRAHTKTPMTLTGHRRFHTLKGWFKRRIRTPAVPRRCTSSR